MSSASTDGCINIFDLGSSKLLKKVGSHEKPVYSIDFSSDGGSLASSAADNTVMVWDAKNAVNDPKDSLIGCYYTKQTPISKVHFSHRNILFVAGSFVV